MDSWNAVWKYFFGISKELKGSQDSQKNTTEGTKMKFENNLPPPSPPTESYSHSVWNYFWGILPGRTGPTSSHKILNEKETPVDNKLELSSHPTESESRVAGVWNYFFGTSPESEQQLPTAPQKTLDGNELKLDSNPELPLPSSPNINNPGEFTKKIPANGDKKTTSKPKIPAKCQSWEMKWDKCGDKQNKKDEKLEKEKHKSKCDKSKPVDQGHQGKTKSSNKSKKVKHEKDENANTVNVTAPVQPPVHPPVQPPVQSPAQPTVEPKVTEKKKEPKQRTCGKITVDREDNNLPDVNQSDLEPVVSNIRECYKLKLAYDECFQQWFAYGFLNGSTDTQPCQDILQKYTACVKNGLDAQDFKVYQPGCFYSSDPDDHRVEKPRKRPPSGADYHQD